MSSTTDHVHEGHDQIALASPEGPLHPSMTRWGIRGMGDFTAEELARLHQKLDGWIRQRDHDTKRPRRRPWVMKPHMAHPA
jgi:hypothetical protein